jgi:hypothetical protein
LLHLEGKVQKEIMNYVGSKRTCKSKYMWIIINKITKMLINILLFSYYWFMRHFKRWFHSSSNNIIFYKNILKRICVFWIIYIKIYKKTFICCTSSIIISSNSIINVVIIIIIIIYWCYTITVTLSNDLTC